MPGRPKGGGIGALVLTYNRQPFLAECLDSILAQSEPPDEIIVLDNGSVDGTCDYLARILRRHEGRLLCYGLRENVGPAGGFDTLFRLGHARGFDWLWCLEDDIVADRDALKALKTAYAENFAAPEELGFLQSVALSAAGAPSNVPEIDLRASAYQCPSWSDRLEAGLVKLRWATLNSLLVPRSTLTRVGGLSPDFRFAGEDIDFTLRVTEALPGYLVGRSKITHRREVDGYFSVLTQTSLEKVRLARSFYRNNVYLRRRYYSRLRTLLYVARCLAEAGLALRVRPYPLRRAASILGGIATGLWFAPTYHPLEAPPMAPPVPIGAAAPIGDDTSRLAVRRIGAIP